MNVDFKIKIANTGTKYFVVKVVEIDFAVLENFSSHDWTPEKAQEIIDGVENAKTNGVRYEWANEDVHLVALKVRVFFFDLSSRRADKNHPEGQDLDLNHDEFIAFLTDFKKFIEENS